MFFVTILPARPYSQAAQLWKRKARSASSDQTTEVAAAAPLNLAGPCDHVGIVQNDN